MCFFYNFFQPNNKKLLKIEISINPLLISFLSCTNLMASITLDDLNYAVGDYPGIADTMASGFTDIIIKPNLQVHLIVDPDTHTFSRRKMLAQINGLYALDCSNQFELDEQSCVIHEQIKVLSIPIDEQNRTLGFLLNILTNLNNPTKQCKHGFSMPHSWYVDSNDVAFEPKQNVTVSEMIDDIMHVINPDTIFIDRRGNVRSYTINSTAHIDHHNSMSCYEMMDNLLDELYFIINSD